MSKYPLYELNDKSFEELTVHICQKILGEGVIPFAEGTDGGRDAKFTGKANLIPSESESWEGKIVIQAKFTSRINASCSDSQFKSRLTKEVLPALERLKALNKVDYYLLFTNAKLTGRQDEKIEDLIDNEIGVANLIIAEEKIQSWLRSFPEIVRALRLNELLRPVQFDETDLKDLIEAIHKTLPTKHELQTKSNSFDFSEMVNKNKLNALSKDYFDAVMLQHYVYFDAISEFLKNPINNKLQSQFDDLVDELNTKITLYRKEYFEFEFLLETLYDYVIQNNNEFLGSGKKRLVRVFLNYLYCNCFIGKTHD